MTQDNPAILLGWEDLRRWKGEVVCKEERSSTREEASGFSGVSRAGTLAHPQGPLGSTF